MSLISSSTSYLEFSDRKKLSGGLRFLDDVEEEKHTDGSLMADSASESHSYFNAGTLGLRNISSSFFGIPGFFVGFGTKVSSESESLRSPTSPLDFKFFSNLSNPFSIRPPVLSSQSGNHKSWDSSEVGLGIINSIVDKSGPTTNVLDLRKRKNVIFGPEVVTKIPTALNHCYKSSSSAIRSNSFPGNYRISSLYPAKVLNSESAGISDVRGNVYHSEAKQLEATALYFPYGSRTSISDIRLNDSTDTDSKISCLENKTSTEVTSSGAHGEKSWNSKPSSLPIATSSRHAYVGSLSAREIALSEDYTCIISHGPNPKKTHIFGDCILENHSNEFENFVKGEEPGIDSPQEAKSPGELILNPQAETLLVCYRCKKYMDAEDISLYRGEKAFCSFECGSQEAFAEEEEAEKAHSGSCGSSPRSCYHEDIFFMGMPIAL